jgi:hypothetical protein
MGHMCRSFTKRCKQIYCVVISVFRMKEHRLPEMLNYECGGNLTYTFGNAREGETYPYIGTYTGIRGRHVHKASRAVTLPEIVRKN